MLKVTIPESEWYYESADGSDDHFVTVKETTLQMEHSLVSLSKWESKWHKPFLSDQEKTNEELLDYIKCMTLTQNVDDQVFKAIPMKQLNEINDYISNPMTATVINDPNKKKSREIITSEIIYYWMISLNIPMECQKWHLNRLLMLIQVCSIKNSPSKKMSRNAIYSQNRSLNKARRAAHHSKG